MDFIEKAIGDRIGDKAMIFVFPSAAAAEFRLRASVLGPGPRAADSGRFIAWDSFKELCFGKKEDLRPANAVLRTLFAASLLAENSRTPIFSELVGSGFPESSASFLPYLRSILPGLKSFVERARAAALPESPYIDDLFALSARYEAFLAAAGYFEPSWREKAFVPGRSRYAVFMPELIDDFREFDPYFAAHPGALETIPVPKRAEGLRLVRYPNALTELKAVFRRMGKLIDSGIPAQDIAVTMPLLAERLGYLEREAALASVPCDFRAGRSLAEYPAGRLYGELLACAKGNFAFEPLKNLLRNRLYPWKGENARAGERLVEYGIRFHALSGWTGESGPIDVWERNFRARPGGEDYPGIERLYRGLKSQISKIAGAKSFREAKKSLKSFTETFFDKEGWGEEERVVERAMIELEELSRAEEDSKGLPVPEPFSLFVQHLRSVPYVKRGGAAGVRFYAYRVSAGIAPKFHFILDCSQKSVSVSSSLLPFLRDDLKEKLGFSEEDRSSSFIDAYSFSGGEVSFSFSETSLDGFSIPHGRFMTGGAIESYPEDEFRRENPYIREKEFWARRGELPGLLHPPQLEGFARHLRIGPDRGEGVVLEGECLAGVAKSLSDTESGFLRMSATDLNMYYSCPYSYFIQKALGIEERIYGIDFMDSRLLGTLYHSSLEELFNRIKAEGGAFLPERAGEYKTWLNACFDFAERRARWFEGEFLEPLLEPLRTAVVADLGRFIDMEAETYPEYAVEGVELRVSLEYPAREILLVGKVDRISLGPEGLVLVDYKKGNTPTKKELRAILPSEGGESAEEEEEFEESGLPEAVSFQIPAYLELLESKGKDVAEAVYYSVDFTAYKKAVSDSGGYLSKAEGETARTIFREMLFSAVEGIRAGRFEALPFGRRSKACMGCPARGVCRRRYRVR